MQRAHFAVAAILAVCLVPLLHAAHLPTEFNWAIYFHVYFAATLQSAAVAIVLGAIGEPSMLWRALTTRGPKISPWPAVAAFLLPGAYLFLALVLTFSYNDIIATFRFTGAADVLLGHIDALLLRGHTVESLSRLVPMQAFAFLEGFYVSMFPLVGGCLFFLAFTEGRKRAMQFVGAIASSYFIGLALFYALPATGPYYNSGFHPPVDVGFTDLLNAIRTHRFPLRAIGLEYFVAFPCLHIAQPLIVAWFLRKSKRLAAAVAAYSALLVPTILFLQQHYVVDLIGGVATAGLVVLLQKESETMQKKNLLYAIPKRSEGGIGQLRAVRELQEAGIEARPYPSLVRNKSGVQVFGGQRVQRKAVQILEQ